MMGKHQLIRAHYNLIYIWDVNWRGHFGSQTHSHSNSDINKKKYQCRLRHIVPTCQLHLSETCWTIMQLWNGRAY